MQKSKTIEKIENSLSETVNSKYLLFKNNYRVRVGHDIHTVPAWHFAPFFALCDKQWGDIPNNYEILIDTLTEAQIQQGMPVLKWLLNTNHIEVDEKTAKIIELQGWIQKIAANFDNELPIVLQKYIENIQEKYLYSKLQYRTVIAMLQPVMYLCIEMGVNGSNLPTQAQIDGYIKKKKGSRTHIAIFRKFLNENFGINLVCKHSPQKKAVLVDSGYNFVDDKKRQLCEKTLLELALQPKPLNDKQKLDWIENAIRYFHRHDIKLKTLQAVEIQDCNENDELIVVIYDEIAFPIPKL